MDSRTFDRQELSAVIESLPEGTEFPLVVTGHSMEPFFINRQTIVYLLKDSTYEPRVGDVVFFCRLDGAFVLHRVRTIRPDGKLVINGDAQTWTEVIAPEQIVAHVTHYRRREKGRDRRMDSAGCRFWKTIWRPLKPIHAFTATCYYYWTRIPYKLGIKKDKKETSVEQ